jgi:hypothetical protein
MKNCRYSVFDVAVLLTALKVVLRFPTENRSMATMQRAGVCGFEQMTYQGGWGIMTAGKQTGILLWRALVKGKQGRIREEKA